MTERRRLDRRSAFALGLLALPVIGYLVFIAFYGVNTIVLDQWTDISLLQKVYSGHAGFAALWAPHNENRILFPDLVVVVLAYLTHLDITVEYYLDAALLVASASLVVVVHRRRAEIRRDLVWYVPVVALMFTLAQYYNTLTGFQLAWYLAMTAILVSLAILDRDDVGNVALALAIVVGVIASFSSVEGLFVWPAGLVLLLLRRRPWRRAAVWLVAAVVVSVLYLHNLALGTSYSWPMDRDHPWLVIRFALLELGDVLGFGISARGDPAAEILLEVVGTVVLLVALLALWRAASARTREGPAPFGAALIVVGLSFAVVTALGRTLMGQYAGSASRFVTFDLFPIVGSYLVLLAEPAMATRRTRRFAPIVAAVALLTVASFGVYHGIEGGRATQRYDNAASDVVVNIEKAPDILVETDVYPLIDAAYVRALVPVARAHHLSLFDTPAATDLARRGLYVGLSFKWR